MLKQLSLLITSALVLSGCGTVDDLINDTVNDVASGDVTTETIAAENKVLIINNVSLTACVIIKNGLINDNDFSDAKTLVTELGVTCATYGKEAGVSGELDTVCVEQSLAEWLEEDNNEDIVTLEQAEGDKACVIGGDI